MSTPLRTSMENALILRGLADRTRESYLQAIAKLARHYRCRPDLLTPEQVASWLLYLVTERKLSYSSVNQAASACRFFYNTVLGRERADFPVPMAKTPQRQPEILGRAEVARLLSLAGDAKTQAFLKMVYATGLRVSEACALRVEDIDSQPDRMCIRVRQGKGGQDRYTILAPSLLSVLRTYWGQYHPRTYLFPNPGGSSPMDIKVAQRRYQRARAAAHITKDGGIHTLRHCFATHLLESGVDLVTIQKLMGHKDLSTTGRYLHLASTQWHRTAPEQSPFDLLAALPKQ